MSTQRTQYAEDSPYAAASPPQSSITSLLAQILARYERQWHSAREMAKLEMKLSLRCVGLMLGLGLCALLLAGFLWLGVLGGIAYGLYMAGVPAWLLIIGFIAVQVLALWWIAATVQELVKEVGFHRSIKALTNNLHASDSSTSANPATAH